MRTHDKQAETACRHLLELEASTRQVMRLVAAGHVSGLTWDVALETQRRSFDLWLEYSEVTEVRTDSPYEQGSEAGPRNFPP